MLVQVHLLPFVMVAQGSSAPSVLAENIYSDADTMPTYPGGYAALNQYISKNCRVRYQLAKGEEGMNIGNVEVDFVVEVNGKLSYVNTLGLRRSLIDESLRLVKGMPNWKPGITQGKPRCVRMKLFFEFDTAGATVNKDMYYLYHPNEVPAGERVRYEGNNAMPKLVDETAVNVGGEAFTFVEQMPQFVGGDKALIKYIEDHVVYPESARKKGIEGKVIVKFVIDETGAVTKPQIMRGIDADCDAEALRVVRTLPNFIPGKQNGKNVKVDYMLPIVFKL